MKKIQQRVKKFCQKNDLNSSVEDCLLDLMSELGEVAKEILKTTNYGRKANSSGFRNYNRQPSQAKKNYRRIKTELGDVFYSLVTVANSLEINLEEALDIALEKYQKRLLKGSAGSESE